MKIRLPNRQGHPVIERYTANERSHHWSVAITFVLMALSGFALFHPALFWLTNLFGGGPWTRILHPFIGVVMVVLFVFLVARFWSHNKLDANDKQWLKQGRDVVENREENLPPVGRYNAGQKLLFYTLIVCMLVLFLSGLVIWRAYFSAYFGIDAVRFASLLHAFFAFVMLCSIIVHVYAAIWVKGSIGAMVRGVVSYGWARKHHRAWYDEVVRREDAARTK